MIALIASMHGFGVPRTTRMPGCAEIVRAQVRHGLRETRRKPVRSSRAKKFSRSACNQVLLDCKVIAFCGPIIGISVAFERSPSR
ncbi:hypothetical protein [Caballeronia insecticola]|uniref:Uncharacterized protein n=1 Tax=Caballeronia insecticola TaxID=758793 RepID=R4WU15_9BURK|nr:hypothetical protein [Caballeronia insecticola]BAN28064.1 hypothetical protein BRPE64_DCDS11280 [Caballeronia insecticola]